MGVTNCNDIRIGNAYRGALEAYLSGAFEPPRYGEVLASEKPPLESFFDEETDKETDRETDEEIDTETDTEIDTEIDD